MPQALKGRSPLYQQLRSELHARIRRGEFGHGQLLPSENQLCAAYGVSITTARRALLELVKDGVVQRRAGVGTTVASDVRHAHLAFVSLAYQEDAWRENTAAMGELVAGIGEVAWQREASLSMSGVDESAADEFLRSLVEARSVDGVLLRTPNDLSARHIEVLEQGAMPYVAIKRDLPDRLVNCVVSDDAMGARIATEHLLESGHRAIGFVCAKPSLGLTQSRLNGYRQALAAAGVRFDPRLVRLEPSFESGAGEQAVRALLRLHPRPTAIFAASDTMAIGGYQAVKEAGLRMPEDLALVGYDDIGPAAVLDPPLTTVRTSYNDFGRLATELLLDLLEGAVVAPRRIVITPRLVVRESTGGPPRRVREVPVPGAVEVAAGPAVRLAGEPAALVGRVREALSGAGARVAEEGEAAVWSLDLRRSLARSLAAARGGVERILRAPGTSAILMVAATPHEEYAARAAEAGLRQVVEALAKERRGVRVNGLLLDGSDACDPGAPALFLLSEAGSAVNGQVLKLCT